MWDLFFNTKKSYEKKYNEKEQQQKYNEFKEDKIKTHNNIAKKLYNESFAKICKDLYLSNFNERKLIKDSSYIIEYFREYYMIIPENIKEYKDYYYKLGIFLEVFEEIEKTCGTSYIVIVIRMSKIDPKKIDALTKLEQLVKVT